MKILFRLLFLLLLVGVVGVYHTCNKKNAKSAASAEQQMDTASTGNSEDAAAVSAETQGNEEITLTNVKVGSLKFQACDSETTISLLVREVVVTMDGNAGSVANYSIVGESMPSIECGSNADLATYLLEEVVRNGEVTVAAQEAIFAATAEAADIKTKKLSLTFITDGTKLAKEDLLDIVGLEFEAVLPFAHD